MNKKIKHRLKRMYLFCNDYLLFNIKGFFRYYIIRDKNTELLKSLKDKYKGKRCFIVATGPSLRIEDVEKLKNEITFSVNSIFLIFDKTEWRSTYYLCLDERHLDNMISKYGNEINNVCKELKFFNSNSRSRATKAGLINKSAFLNISSINELRYLTDATKDPFYFRTDASKGIYNSGTVTNSAIIMAMYMGFKDIYLIGTDCNYRTKIKHVGQDWNDLDMDINEQELIELRMRNGFNEIAKCAKKYEANIYNATRGGMLESFPRVDFDSLFAEDNK